jgi:hypothetical protein
MKKKLTLHRVTVRNLAPEMTEAVDGNGISILPTLICPTRSCITCFPSCYNTCLGGIC